jgi:hypothetical protein
MNEKTRGIVMAVCGILVLALNLVEAADRGASVINFITIATGAFLLIYGFLVVGRNPG